MKGILNFLYCSCILGVCKNLAFDNLNPSPFSIREGYKEFLEMPLSLIAALEAMTGLMIFAIITGLLYGRFADPSAKILFSKNMLVSSFGDDLGLQFQIVNKRKSTSMDFNARVIYSHQERDVKFEPMYSTNANNIVELDFSKLDAYQKLK